MHFTKIASALAALATPTIANLQVTNWCQYDIIIWQSHNGSCNTGPNGICSSQPDAIPFSIPRNRNTHSIPLIADDTGTSAKILNGNNAGVLQYEYSVSNGILFWDVSDIDGAGAASNGSPFYAKNVKIIPTGKGVGEGTYKGFKCAANEIFGEAYNAPDEVKTRACAAGTGDMWLDLCQPDPWFNQKRARDFTVTAREAKKLSFWEALLRYFGKRDSVAREVLVVREGEPKTIFLGNAS